MRRCWNCCGLKFDGEVCPNCGGAGEIVAQISLGEGDTPLYRSAVWENVWIKDERQNPTGTFKDRQAAAIVREAMGSAGIVVASTGNIAIACTAYAARAGLELWAFLPARRRARSRQRVEAFGGHVVLVEATYDQTKVQAEEFAEGRGLFYARGMDYTSAMAAIAHEIHDQLGRVPDWYVQAVSGGIGPVGVCRGFQERAGEMPRVLAAQIEDCAPMVRSAEKGSGEVEPVAGSSAYAATLGTGNPAEAYRFLWQAGATFMSVSGQEAHQATRAAMDREGIFMEPASAVAFAALKKALDSGVISRDEMVVINCSGR